MPMGLITAPKTLIQTMNNLFVDLLDKVVVFLYDILIYSRTMEEHFELLEKVFTRLYKYAFYYKPKKCSFFYKTTTFLGFKITPEGMHISDAKVQSLKGWLKPSMYGHFWVSYNISIIYQSI